MIVSKKKKKEKKKEKRKREIYFKDHIIAPDVAEAMSTLRVIKFSRNLGYY
jgi:hypothetical protein